MTTLPVSSTRRSRVSSGRRDGSGPPRPFAWRLRTRLHTASVFVTDAELDRLAIRTSETNAGRATRRTIAGPAHPGPPPAVPTARDDPFSLTRYAAHPYEPVAGAATRPPGV